MKKISHFLYPPRCPICEKIPPKGFLICPICYSSISFVEQPFCYSCGKPLDTSQQEFCFDCTRNPKSFTRGFSLAVYNSITKPSLSAIKYNNRRQHLNFYVKETVANYELFSHLYIWMPFFQSLSIQKE